jgi:hypothetical protein
LSNLKYADREFKNFFRLKVIGKKALKIGAKTEKIFTIRIYLAHDYFDTYSVSLFFAVWYLHYTVSFTFFKKCPLFFSLQTSSRGIYKYILFYFIVFADDDGMAVSTTATTSQPHPSEGPKPQNLMPTDVIESVNNSGSGKPVAKEPGSSSSIGQRLAKEPGSDDGGGKLAKEPGSSDQRLAKESSSRNGSTGKRFACDECDYSARLPHHLKGHKRTHHEIVWLGCQLCDYQVVMYRRNPNPCSFCAARKVAGS